MNGSVTARKGLFGGERCEEFREKAEEELKRRFGIVDIVENTCRYNTELGRYLLWVTYNKKDESNLFDVFQGFFKPQGGVRVRKFI